MPIMTDYKSKGRSWVKLWVNEWLDGTTRYEMTGAQRAFWVDLLTMAGRSRVPGTVCSGLVNSRIVGYPLPRLEGILNDVSVDVLETLDLFERTGKVRITVTREEAPKLYAIEVLSWAKYQSEYMRQKVSRNKSKHDKVRSNVTPENTTRCAVEEEVEVEVEVEVEGEGDTEKAVRRAATATADYAFLALGHKIAFGSAPFQNLWREQYSKAGNDPNWMDIMEETIQKAADRRIKVPGVFYKHKHEIENGEIKMRYKVTPQ